MHPFSGQLIHVHVYMDYTAGLTEQPLYRKMRLTWLIGDYFQHLRVEGWCHRLWILKQKPNQMYNDCVLRTRIEICPKWI